MQMLERQNGLPSFVILSEIIWGCVRELFSKSYTIVNV